MYESHNTSSKTEHEKEVDDSDLTPKPLRIVKRGSPWKYGSLAMSTALSTSPIQRTFVPARSSSISSGSTQVDSASAVTSRSCRRGSLHLHKQRRSDPTCTISTAAGASSGYSTKCRGSRGLPFYQRMSDIVDGGMVRRSSCVAQVESLSRHTDSRAFTTGAIKKPITLDSVNDGLSSTAPTLATGDSRRAMTAMTAHRQGEEAEDDGHSVLRREPLFKHRLMNRMMNGLSHRPHISHSTAMDQGRSPLTQENTSATQPQVLDALHSSIRTSSSSERADTLNSALASFPTPPTSNEASPTNFDPFPYSYSGSRRYRELCKPEQTAIMGAELRLTAEHDESDSKNAHSMLVSIDIEGTLNKSSSEQSLWSQHTGLDVAVIIDNSLYTSPNMLMASCETTRALASTLNMVTDRMAILCTSPINEHRTLGADFTKIWPLSSIKPQKLKTVLDAIVNTKKVPSTSAWASTIQSATELLLESPVPDAEAEILQDTFGFVIILTANAEGLSSGLLTHDKLHFHVICPASVPRNTFDAIDCNGWKLRSMSGQEPLVVRAQRDTDPKSLLNRLRELIVHARGGKDAGKLTYLSLDLKPGPYCRIESVMGKSEYLLLHPGELRTILVRLRVPPSKVQEDMLSRSATLPAVGQHSNDIQDELDRMLRVTSRPSKVLTARLKYKHSLLSSNTTCSVVAECNLKKRVPNSVEEMQSGNTRAHKPVKVATLVHERLAYHLATHGSPINALSAFCDEFGNEGWRSYCPDYTHLILNELKYQARIAERFEIDASPKKPSLQQQMNTEFSSSSLSGYRSQDAFANENSRPDTWYTENPNDEPRNSPRVQLVTLSDLRKATKPVLQMYAELEQTRILWDDQRKNSTASNDLSGRRSFSSKLEEERKQSLRQLVAEQSQTSNGSMAVWKKRSITAAAMRRITSAGESLGKGLGGI